MAKATSDTEIDYSAAVTTENEFINHRMGWLLTSQSIFFTGYVLAPPTPKLPELIEWLPKLGLLITLLIYVSIFAAVMAIAYYHKKRPANYGHVSFQIVGPIAPSVLPLLIAGTWLWVINDKTWTITSITAIVTYIAIMVLWGRKPKHI